MNKTINIKIKYLLLSIAVFCLLIYLLVLPELQKDTIEVVKTSTVKVVEKKDSISVDYQPKKTKEVKVATDSVTKKVRKVTKDAPIKPTEIESKAKEYKETFHLKNGTIQATILSESKILAAGFKLFTNDSIFTNTITKTITKYRTPNVWFLNYEPIIQVFPVPVIYGHQISVDYTIKGKLRLGAGVGFLNGFNNQIFTTFKIGIRL